MDDERGSDPGPLPRRAILLKPWQRIATGCVGALTGGAGGLAVFTTDNQAGSTALLLLSGLALLMSVTGRVPDKIGKEGMAYEPDGPAVHAVKQVLSDPSVPLDTREIVAEAVRNEFDRRSTQARGDVALTAGQAELSIDAAWVLFESRVTRALEAIALSRGLRLEQQVRRGRIVIDAVVRKANATDSDLSGAVLFDITRSLTEGSVRRTVHRYSEFNPRAIVFVTEVAPGANLIAHAQFRATLPAFEDEHIGLITVDTSTAAASLNLEQEILQVLETTLGA